MDIFRQLEITHSKENSLKILSYIANDPIKFSALMDCFFMKTKDYRVPQRAAHVVSLSFDQNRDLMKPYLSRLITSLYDPDLKGSLKRNILRILQYSEIPEQQRGKVYDTLFAFLVDPKEEIAVRAFSITVLYNISSFHPELKPELASTIQFVLEEPNCAPGIKSRGNAIMRKLIREGFIQEF